MKYVEIKTLDPETGNILSGIDDSTGRAYNFGSLGAKYRFPHLIVWKLGAGVVPGKGSVVRVKLCEISGAGHFIDIAGEGTQGEESSFIMERMAPPEFWYMTLATAQRYGCV